MKKVSEQAGDITRKTQKQPAMFKPIACSFHGHVYSRIPNCLEIKLPLLHKLELNVSACHGAPHMVFLKEHHAFQMPRKEHHAFQMLHLLKKLAAFPQKKSKALHIQLIHLPES